MFVTFSSSTHFNALYLEKFDLCVFKVLISVSTFLFTNEKNSFTFVVILTYLFRNTALAYYMVIILRSANSFAAFAASLYLYHLKMI